MSFLSSNRTVLILGDEGLQVYSVGRLGAQRVEFLPWGDDNFLEALNLAIIKKCKRKPVVIINDMVEQHYRKERVPKVAIMDRANVLKRRLSVAFPNYKIFAALKLEESKFRSTADGKGLPYLFAAVPSSENLSKVMRAVQSSSVTIIGFYLLPVEASTMVKALSAKVRGKKSDKRKAVWNIFMGQHLNGGVRQIVTRDDDLALTRMSPIVDTDVEPELWAKEMSSELTATMSYLTRFGYSEGDGLNVFVIANEEAHQSVEEHIGINCDLHILTSHEAAGILGVNIGRQNDDRYADPVHAAYLGKKNKFRLPMQFAAIDSVVKTRRIASLVALGLLAGCGYFGYEAFNNWAKSQEAKENFRVSEERKKSLQQDYELELAKKKEIGFDFIMVSNSVRVFNDIEMQKTQPLSLLKKIGQSLGADLHLDKLDVSSKEIKQKKKNPYQQEEPEIKNILEAVMSLSFSSEVDPSVGVKKINDLKNRLDKALPNYEVNIVKQVAGLSHTGNFVGESGSDGKGEKNQDYTAEILVREVVQ